MDADALTETDDPVGVWRYDRADELGFDAVDCHVIAREVQVDLHELAALISAGCSPSLALDILL